MDRKMIGSLIFALLGFIVIFMQPFSGSGLIPLGHQILGTVIIALGLWVFRPGNVPLLAGGSVILFGSMAILTYHMKAKTMLAGADVPLIANNGVVFGTAANGFVSTAVWILIPALYFGFVLQKTGLGKRLAYLVLKSFNPSWVTMALSWFIIGVLLSALTPSITVRIAIVIPIAISIVEACKLEYRSKGAAFVTLLAWGMCIFPGTGWLTGSLSGPIMLGFLPMDMKEFATNANWLKILGPPWMLVTFIFTILAYFFAKPSQPIGISVEIFREEYKTLGPMTRNETIALVTLVSCLILFFSESTHGIPSQAVAMGALFIFIMTGIIEAPELNTGINWDVVMFFGVAIGLSQLFRFTQVTAWFEPLVTPTITNLATSPVTLMLFLTVVLLLIRFVDVPWGFTSIALFASVTSFLFTDFGYHPLVITMAFLITINFFLLQYQQPWMLMADGMIQGRGWAPNHVLLFGAIYLVAAFVALLAAIPYWKAIGVLGGG